MGTDNRSVAIACQGGGSHTAFAAGVLARVFEDVPEGYSIDGFSGTSGGAITAAAAWDALRREGPDAVPDRVHSLWDAIATATPTEQLANYYNVWWAGMEISGAPIPSISPYDSPTAWAGQEQLREDIERYVDFDRAVEPDDPALYVSTVDVLAGKFRTFGPAEVTTDVLLASAAAPIVFPAVDLDGRPHWDGLFAFNPPLKPLLTEPADVADKPDEIWLVRVNPDERETEPRTLRAIADRRRELSGDISLKEQIDFIDRVSEWVEAGYLPRDEYKSVTVRPLQLSKTLPLRSRIDRDPDLIWDLFECGRSTADDFLGELPRSQPVSQA